MLTNKITVVNLSQIRLIAGDVAEEWYQKTRVPYTGYYEPMSIISAQMLIDRHTAKYLLDCPPMPDTVLSCLWAFCGNDPGWINLSA